MREASHSIGWYLEVLGEKKVRWTRFAIISIRLHLLEASSEPPTPKWSVARVASWVWYWHQANWLHSASQLINCLTPSKTVFESLVLSHNQCLIHRCIILRAHSTGSTVIREILWKRIAYMVNSREFVGVCHDLTSTAGLNSYHLRLLGCPQDFLRPS